MKAPADLNRRLGRTEHIYWLLDQLYCLNFLVFAELEGSLNRDDLQTALDIVQQENPVLRAQIVIDKAGQPCFEPVSAAERPLRLEVHGLRNWRRNVEAQLVTPFEKLEAPLARVLWFRGKGKKSVVAMVFHHSIADGKSGASVLFDVLRRATGKDRRTHFKAAHPSSQQLDLIQDKGLVAGKLKELRFWLGKGRDVLKFPRQLPGYDMEPGDARKIKTIPFSISPEANTTLLANCRDRGTTMHGALGAALLLALNSEFEDVESRFLGLNSLADLRNVLKANLTEQDLGLYISTLTTVHWLDEEPDFWSLAREIPNRLKEIMNSGDANLINSIYTEIPLFTSDQSGARKVQKIVALAPPSSMLTNIGRITEVPLGKALRVRSLAFAVSPPAQHPICVTAASYGGQMYLNILYDQCKVADDQARRITENIQSKLLEQAGPLEANFLRT
jgi:NRPS condensation-like uncharacterized protein